jgi:hypothetical protein
MSDLVVQWEHEEAHHAALSKCLDISKNIVLPTDPAAFVEALKDFNAPMPELSEYLGLVETLKKANDDFRSRNHTSLSIVEEFAKDLFPVFAAAFVKYLTSMNTYDLPRITKSVLSVLGGDEGAFKTMQDVFTNSSAIPPKAICKPYMNHLPKLFGATQVKSIQALADNACAAVKLIHRTVVNIPYILEEKSTVHELASQNLMALIKPAFLDGLSAMTNPEFMFASCPDFVHLRNALVGNLRLFLTRATADVHKLVLPICEHALCEDLHSIVLLPDPFLSIVWLGSEVHTARKNELTYVVRFAFLSRTCLPLPSAIIMCAGRAPHTHAVGKQQGQKES